MKKKLITLFISTFYLSAFTFGGGYVIVTLMRKKFVSGLHWIEMLDLVAIAQSAPGAIAVNGAIVVGYKIAGLPGVFIASLGTITPPFLIISLISFVYQALKSNIIVSLMLEGMQAGVGAVIASVCFELGAGILKEKSPIYIVVMIGSFIASYFFKINVMIVIISCILIGIVYSLKERKEQK